MLTLLFLANVGIIFDTFPFATLYDLAVVAADPPSVQSKQNAYDSERSTY